jgi:hypothetical protein
MDGKAEALRGTRGSAVTARWAALQRLHNFTVEAPAELRDQLRHLSRMQLTRTCAACPPTPTRSATWSPPTGSRSSSVRQRILHLHDEIRPIRHPDRRLVGEVTPRAHPGSRHRP